MRVRSITSPNLLVLRVNDLTLFTCTTSNREIVQLLTILWHWDSTKSISWPCIRKLFNFLYLAWAYKATFIIDDTTDFPNLVETMLSKINFTKVFLNTTSIYQNYVRITGWKIFSGNYFSLNDDHPLKNTINIFGISKLTHGHPNNALLLPFPPFNHRSSLSGRDKTQNDKYLMKNSPHNSELEQIAGCDLETTYDFHLVEVILRIHFLLVELDIEKWMYFGKSNIL